MVVLSFLLRGNTTGGFFRDCINCLILLILLVKHYQDFPFKSKYVQKISGGLLLWLFMVSLINVLDAALALNNFLNIEMVKILLLVLSIKIYAQWTE